MPLPEAGYDSSLTYVQGLLDTDVFYDDVRAQQFVKGDLTEQHYGSRLQLGMQVARAVATARWQNRRHKAQECGDSYLEMSPDEKWALAEPRFEEVDDIQASLAPQRHRLQLINNFEQYCEDIHVKDVASHLRANQRDVLDAFVDFMNEPGEAVPDGAPTKAGYIKMPTGTGKTVVAVELVKALGFPKTLILTSRKDILRQTVGKDGKRGFSQFAPDAHVTSYYQDEQNLEGDIVVMTYASFNNLVSNNELDASCFELVICDEAHRALGETTSKNVQSFIEGKIAVGLTATDEYAENKSVDQLLPECIYEVGLREAIHKGWLAPVQAWIYKTSVEIDQDNRKDFSSSELQRLADLEGRNRKAIEFAQKFVSEGVQGIISCIPGENVRHAEDIAALLRATEIVDRETGEIRKIRAQELRGDMSMQDRQAVYADYEAGKIDVLTFVDMLVEGWDSHAAKFLINLRPTCSQVFGTQRLGRILRPTGEGFPAQVIDFLDITAKAQFTALHALGEYRYQAGKIYASAAYAEKGGYKQMHLQPYMADSITKINLRKVSDIVVGRPYEADFSEALFIKDVAARLNVPEAAILYLAEEHDLAIEMAEGGLGAATAQIREVDRDKISRLIRDQYDWLRGRTNEWMYDYIARRKERLIQMQTSVIASVVTVHEEGLHEAAKAERQDIEAAQKREDQLLAEQRNERLAEYEQKNLDKIIGAFSKGKLTIDDFREVVYRKASSGTMLPMDVVHLGMTGRREGVWGEIQESLVYGMMLKPYLAVSALNIGQQLGQVISIENNLVPNMPNTRCNIRVVFKNGKTIETYALGKDRKVAQQVASTYVIAEMVGMDTAALPNPHRIKLRTSPKKELQITFDDEEELIESANPKGDLITIFQKSHKKMPKFQMQYANGQAGVCVRLVFEARGESHTVYGRGSDRKEAERHASLRALTFHRDTLNGLSAPDPLKVQKVNARYTENTNPINFLNQRSKTLHVGPAAFKRTVTDEGTYDSVEVVDNHGQKQTFNGFVVPPVTEELDKTELRNRYKASRLDACRQAIEYLLTNTLDGNK